MKEALQELDRLIEQWDETGVADQFRKIKSLLQQEDSVCEHIWMGDFPSLTCRKCGIMMAPEESKPQPEYIEGCMTDKKELKNGGAAFPIEGYTDGMSLRQFYAAHALQGIMANQLLLKSIEVDCDSIADSPNRIANLAHIIAESMIIMGEKLK